MFGMKLLSLEWNVGRYCAMGGGGSNDSDDELLLLLSFCKCKRKWVHGMNLRRTKFAEFHHLIKQLHEDEVKFKEYFQMNGVDENILSSSLTDKRTMFVHYLVYSILQKSWPRHYPACSGSDILLTLCSTNMDTSLLLQLIPPVSFSSKRILRWMIHNTCCNQSGKLVRRAADTWKRAQCACPSSAMF